MTPSRKSSDVRFMVNVCDLDSAHAFWEGRLGFAVSETFPGGMMIDLGSGTLELFSTTEQADELPRLSIEAVDLDELWSKWKSEPEVGHTLRTSDWGDRSFSLLDPNGIEVIFFKPL